MFFTRCRVVDTRTPSTCPFGGRPLDCSALLDSGGCLGFFTALFVRVIGIAMKEGIHPKYEELTVHCSCGTEFVTRSTSAKLHVDICSKCHPFFTGTMKFIDSAGRVEKFSKKYNWKIKGANADR